MRMIDEIMGAVRKSSTLVNSLTAIARKDKPNVSLADPGRVVEQIIDLRRYDLKASQIAIDCVCEAPLPMLLIDQPKLEQSIIYLIANAIEELRDAERRLLKVRVRNTGDGADIELWNSGRVVPEELRESIFEPFFTTKDDDHLGLGLSVARDIARLHGGDLTYSPERGLIFGHACDVSCERMSIIP